MPFPGQAYQLGMPGAMPTQAGLPGLPEHQGVQQNLNDYYARLWATYANPNETPGSGSKDKQVVNPENAFDKEALLKLASKASDPEPEMPPMPPEAFSGAPPPGMPWSPDTAPPFNAGEMADRSAEQVEAMMRGMNAE